MLTNGWHNEVEKDEDSPSTHVLVYLQQARSRVTCDWVVQHVRKWNSVCYPGQPGPVSG